MSQQCQFYPNLVLPAMAIDRELCGNISFSLAGETRKGVTDMGKGGLR